MTRIVPCLWFDGQAEEAARFYVSLLPQTSRIDSVVPQTVDTPGGKAGGTLTVEFTLDGQRFLALNGGPYFTPNGAVSFIIECDGQGEIDRLWDAILAAGGKEIECGWITDRYGYHLQIVPKAFSDMIREPSRSAAVMQAMMGMKKLDLARLEAAWRGS
ncbi:VOC family protein [Aurantimonas sp. MSK8Z-1]|uniref:VOC family protein n=1 Tax=Mangrovibrevibacter kandeliae TaxID=2968473 RepID=UPI002117F71C|nr:VOC family protein [Aurantimonas sp. MSK8Z-1]MCW4116338.1 VOC family protein [Aurantimonas sp. MSK8Z-1]